MGQRGAKDWGADFLGLGPGLLDWRNMRVTNCSNFLKKIGIRKATSEARKMAGMMSVQIAWSNASDGFVAKKIM